MIPFHARRRVQSAPAVAGSYPLDGLSVPAVGAYSTARRLVGSYMGPLIRVRRTTGDEVDIGQDSSGFLDVATLLNFVGVTTGGVVKWYDQSGNNKDMTFTTGAFTTPPPIVESGVLLTSNNKPVIVNNGFRNLSSPSFFASTGWSASIHAAEIGTAFFYHLFCFYPTTGNTPNDTDALSLLVNNTNIALHASGVQQFVFPAYASRNQYFFRVNTNAVHTQLNGVTNNASPVLSVASHFKFAFGGLQYAIPWNGTPHKCGEVVFWNSVLSDADRDSYKTDMADFWDVSVS